MNNIAPRTNTWDESRVRPEYGSWSVVGSSVGIGKDRRIPCRCKCGTESMVLYFALKKGKSFRCRHCANIAANKQKKRTHGKTNTAEFRIWSGIKTRCFNQNTPSYQRYGGRGISMCDQWRNSFEAFLADVGPRPSPQHSIDRYPNNDGDYEPGNVRWATQKQQSNNRRSTKLSESQVSEVIALIRDGLKQVEIAKRFGVCFQLISRIKIRNRREAANA